MNTTISSCNNITGVTWSIGAHNITIWVNDSAGNTNYSTILFNISDDINPDINITFPLQNNTNQF